MLFQIALPAASAVALEVMLTSPDPEMVAPFSISIVDLGNQTCTVGGSESKSGL